MHFLLGYHLAPQDVAHEEVVVHRVGDDLGDGGRVEFDEAVVLGFTGLIIFIELRRFEGDGKS